jgi:hypothetical protein
MALLPIDEAAELFNEMTAYTERIISDEPYSQQYEEFNADAVYDDSDSTDSRAELRADLDFVEDTDVAHEFDT